MAHGADKMVESHALVADAERDQPHKPIGAIRAFTTCAEKPVVPRFGFLEKSDRARSAVLLVVPQSRYISEFGMARKGLQSCVQQFFRLRSVVLPKAENNQISKRERRQKSGDCSARLPHLQQRLHAAARRRLCREKRKR